MGYAKNIKASLFGVFTKEYKVETFAEIKKIIITFLTG